MQYLVINNNGKEYKKECIYVYNRVILWYSRNEHNTVNQLYFNKMIKGKIFLQISIALRGKSPLHDLPH